MKVFLNSIIGELARKDFAYIQLFQQYGIDFYCNGDRTLQEAISNSKVDFDEVLSEIKLIQEKEKASLYKVDVETWPLDLLADYIQKTHHKFTDQILVKLRKQMEVMISSNVQEKEILERIHAPFDSLAKELGAHMKREELILFPAIRRMLINVAKREPINNSVENPVDQMMHEHQSQDMLLREIRSVLQNYEVNKSQSSEYIKFLKMMKELDLDLSLHLHLENNILFSKALEFEFNN